MFLLFDYSMLFCKITMSDFTLSSSNANDLQLHEHEYGKVLLQIFAFLHGLFEIFSGDNPSSSFSSLASFWL